MTQANLTVALSTTLIQVDPYFLVEADFATFLQTDVLYARVHNKQDVFEEFVSKRKFERFCELFEIPEDFRKPELKIESLSNGLAMVKINSFTTPDKTYELSFPYIRRGSDPQLITGRYYPCQCERETFSKTRSNLSFEKHKKYVGNFLVDYTNAHDFGVLGFPQRLVEAEGKTIYYVASKYKEKKPNHEFNINFSKKNNLLKRIFYEDFWTGSTRN